MKERSSFFPLSASSPFDEPGPPVLPYSSAARDGVRYRVVLDTAPPGARRRQVTRTFDTIREARDFVSETRTALVRGNFTAPSKLTVRALAEAWLADRQAESESPGGIREVW